MKFIIFLAVLAFAVACVLACDPKGNNKPKCDGNNADKPVRNFNNPNRYWVCKSGGSEAESVRCDKEQAFDESKGECVPFKDFKWTKPCT